MKRFLILMLVTASAFAQPAPTSPPPMMETVTVTGNGKATLTPDRVTFSVGVQTNAPTVEDAVAENNRRVQNVIAALKKAGAADKDIKTANFNVWPQQDYQQGKAPQILGYQVTNTINVRTEKIADAGKLLGVAINAGVNNASGLNFEVSDPARGREQGLKSAFDDAKAKATILAQSAGRTLGRALIINEGVQAPPQPIPMRAMQMEARAAAVSEVPVESGTQELTFQVTATFELR